jgi:hypothetical protein
MTTRRFPPPSTVEETDTCFIVKDRGGMSLTYVYFEEEPGRRSAAHLLTRDEARRIAANIANLPELLSEPQTSTTHFRYDLNFGHFAALRSLTSWANNRPMQRSKLGIHSINSSARPDRGNGMVMPSVLAVLRLMYSSTFVACCTGKSAGFSPLRTRPV